MTKWYWEDHEDPKYEPDASDGSEKSTSRCISVNMGAEYRYVPHFPRVAPAPVQFGGDCPLSHARPVPGGFSGRLEFDLVSESAVLFGAQNSGTSNAATGNGEGGQERRRNDLAATEHARLFDAPDAPYVAPARALKGMLRGTFGTATFAHFRPINGDHRFASRNREYIKLFASGENNSSGVCDNVNNNENSTPSGWLKCEIHEEKIIWWLCQANCFFTYSDFVAASIGSQLLAEKFKKGYILKELEDLKKQEKEKDWASRKIICKGAWDRLSYIDRSDLINILSKRKDSGFYLKVGEAKRYVSGPDKTHHLVTAGPMQGRKYEALFELPACNPSGQGDEGSKVNATAINAFLFNSSAYSKVGAEYALGGRRAPSGHFKYVLADYLRHHKDGVAIAKKLGLIKSDEGQKAIEAISLRDDCSYGIPVYFIGSPGSPSLRIGLSQVIPVPASGRVSDFVHQEALEPELIDWADALFGFVDEDDDAKDNANADDDADASAREKPSARTKRSREAALKSRLTFDFARVREEKELGEGLYWWGTQGQPKVSYDPLTLSKTDAGSGPVGWAAPTENAVLNGYRRYPACRPFTSSPPEGFECVCLDDRRLKRREGKTKSLTRPLVRATYAVAIEFHNLHPLELGALLWAISFGDRAVLDCSADAHASRYRHVGGRLRNKGLGRLRPARLHLASLVQNPMPEGLRWRDACASERDLGATLMEAFEIHMGRFVRQGDGMEGEVRDPQTLRQAFYDCETIRALLNASDAEWSVKGHDVDTMFQLPASGAAYFKNFSNLRALVYGSILPTKGRRTVLDEFLEPEQLPPGEPAPRFLVEEEWDALSALLDPAGALRSSRSAEA